MLHEMVQFVEVYVGKNLAGNIAERQSFAWRGFKRGDDTLNERTKVLVGDSFGNKREENIVVNVGEELAYVALEDESGLCVVCRYFLCKCLKSVHACVCSFVFSRSIRDRKSTRLNSSHMS